MIIVTAHNSLPLTKACLPTLLAQNGKPRILAVDNASTDGTYRWLGTQPVERMYGNFRSVSRMWNEALKYAWSEGFDAAMVCNNDVELRPDTYQLLMADPGDFVTAVGVNDRAQLLPDPEPQNKRLRPDFSCYKITRKCWDTLGGFDEGFLVAWHEDNDFHVRCHRAGIEAYCIGLPFYHYASGTMKSASEKEKERLRNAYDRNKQRFLEMYGCVPSDTTAYDALFDPAMFGVDKAVASITEPL